MTTFELIDAAETAKAADEAAAKNLTLAASAKQAAAAALVAANQALHDDLMDNGPACIVDDTADPKVVTVYTAVDPDTWQSHEIRVAA